MARLNLIPRDNVVPGATDDMLHIGTVVHCEARPVRTLSLTLEASDLQGISTAVDLIGALTGASISVIGVYYSKAAGAYTGGGNLTIQYGDSGNTEIASIAVAEIRDSDATSGWATRASLSGTPSGYSLPTEGVEVLASANFADDGGTLTLTVLYVEVVT